MSIRFSIIYLSLAVVFITILLFVSGPLWDLRLDYEKGQQMQLIQMTTPLFVSYLSAAVAYAISGKETPEPTGERGKILRVMVIGAFLIFIVGAAVGTTMYYISANGTLKSGRLEFDRYSALMTLLLSILGATTSAISMYVFAGKK